MASISTDSQGNRRILFTAPGGKRSAIHLGNMNAKQAKTLKTKVETLASAIAAKLPLDSETSSWLGNIGDEYAAKLAAVGLIPERREAVSLAGLLEVYGREKEGKNKPGTKTNHRTISNDLTGFFGEANDPRTITEDDALRFVEHLRERKLAAATVARRLTRVRSIFEHGLKRKYLLANPFAELKSASYLPPERKAYVSPEDARRLIEAANSTWRTIIALARFAGLRCPSEVLMLKWENVNFAMNRMTVSSPKTEGIPGKAYRVMLIFPALRPYLEDAFELAEAGEVYVVGGKQGDAYRKASQSANGWVNCNLRTSFEKIIRRAGLKQWPRIFHTLRASCETDALAVYPINAVTQWMGHSATVALKHYSRVPEHLFQYGAQTGAVGNVASEAYANSAVNAGGIGEGTVQNDGAYSDAIAAQNTTQTQSATIDREKTNATETPISQASRRVLSDPVPLCSNGGMTLRRFELRSQP